MSELLPNLDSLGDRLEHVGASADAFALVAAARDAASVSELDDAIRTVLEGWRAS